MTRPAPPGATRRRTIDPDVWATPCAVVVDPSADADRLARARRAVEDALAALDDSTVRSRLDDARLEPIPHGGATRLDVRASGRRAVRLVLGPRTKAATRLIEVGPFDPRPTPGDRALRRFLAAFAVHLDGAVSRRLPDEEVARRLALLAAVEVHARVSRALPDGTPTRAHRRGPVEAATPWSPLRTLDGWEQSGRETLTPGERRAWTRPPVVRISAADGRRTHVDGASARRMTPMTVVSIDALRAPVGVGDAVADMKALRALDPPPGNRWTPDGRRTRP